MNKKGLNIIRGGKRAGDEIKIKTIYWNDILFVALNVCGLAWLIGLFIF